MKEHEIEKRFIEAMITIKRLPIDRIFDRPSIHLTKWPKYIRDHKDAYGWTRELGVKLPPTAAQISRMEECLQWLWHISELERKIILDWASKIPIWYIAKKYKKHRQTIWRIKKKAIRQIYKELKVF